MTEHEIRIKVREKRKAMDWSYDEVAKRADVSIYVVHAFFKNKSISTNHFFRILQGMGVEFKII